MEAKIVSSSGHDAKQVLIVRILRRVRGEADRRREGPDLSPAFAAKESQNLEADMRTIPGGDLALQNGLADLAALFLEQIPFDRTGEIGAFVFAVSVPEVASEWGGRRDVRPPLPFEPQSTQGLEAHGLIPVPLARVFVIHRCAQDLRFNGALCLLIWYL